MTREENIRRVARQTGKGGSDAARFAAMTSPSNTDLREAINKLLDFFTEPGGERYLKDLEDDLVKLLQAREQQLLTELLGHAREYEITDLEMLDHHNETPLIAVPVSVIQSFLQGEQLDSTGSTESRPPGQNKTNDGGTE